MSERAFSRAEVVAGLPARRATTLLFAIEGRTSRLLARSRTAMATYLTERGERERERAFLDALAAGRQPVTVRIHDIERFATDWASLVPPDIEVRAAVAALLGDKYSFRAADVPGLRAALGLDDPELAISFQRRHGRPVSSVYAARLPWRDRARWARARLAARVEALPPLWMAFALTLTETVGAGVLALPIAFAGVGPAAAVALLAVFGIVNLVTIGALVEAITRDGGIRYGSTYFGRFVGEYLGRPGGSVVTVTMLLLNVVSLVALMIGFGSSLAGVWPLPAGIWVVLLAVAILLILRKESLDATVVSVLVIGGLNLALLVAISVIALATPATAGAGAGTGAGSAANAIPGASVAGLVFGVALMAYFGHTSAGNAAKVVLRRDPGGRALLWGNLAAMVAALGLYLLTVLAILHAVPAADLAGFEGTALTPLVERTGPAVAVLGSVFVVLAMGLSSLHIALGLYNQVGEWLPTSAADSSGGAGTVSRSIVRGRRVQAALKAAPVVALLAVVELMLVTGTGSFTGSLGFLGTVTVPLLGGLFPMLLVVATRRRGAYVPGRSMGPLGHPVVVILVAGLFMVGLAAHAVVIWTGAIERIAALAALIAFVFVGAWSLRSSSYRARTVVEVRVGGAVPEPATVSVVASGRHAGSVVRWATSEGSGQERPVPAVVPDAAGLREIRIDVPPDTPAEVLAWSHRVDQEGSSTPWAATVRFEQQANRYPLPLDSHGRATYGGPVAGGTLVIEPGA